MKSQTHFFLPVYGTISAEGLAQRILSALKQGRINEAVNLAQTMCTKYPRLPESFVLLAKTLMDTGRDTEAFDVWDEIIKQHPLKKTWLEQAIFLSLSRNNIDALKRWLQLSEDIFIHPLSSTVLTKLDQHGFHLTGSAGIHCNQIFAWTWMPVEFFPRIVPHGGPAPVPADQSRKIYGTHALTRFSLSLPKSKDVYFISILDGNGQDIKGSPIVCDSGMITSSRKKSKKHHAPAVLIPVYDDKKSTQLCLASLLASRRVCRTGFDIVAIWDHGPDNSLFKYLQVLADNGHIHLTTTPKNIGFLGTVNQGLRLYNNRDIVLLNSDTIVNDDWLDRLRRIADRRSRAGTITPMSSFAELVSYPNIIEPAEVTSRRMTASLDQACRKAAGKDPCREIPVGVGFCMYITRALLNNIGGLDGRWVFNGYGEEVDLCLRARKAGFKNLVALNVFVAHLGGRSFGLKKRALAAQNNKALFIRYPDYDNEYKKFLRNETLNFHCKRITLNLYAPLKGPLHILSSLDYNHPTISNLRDKNDVQGGQWAELLVEKKGEKTILTLRVRQDINLADVSFLLPEQHHDFDKAIKKLLPEKVLIHGPGKFVRTLAQTLKIPMELYLGQMPAELYRLWQNNTPCPGNAFPGIQKIHCKNRAVSQWLSRSGLPVNLLSSGALHPTTYRNKNTLPSSWLTPPPSNLADWNLLCKEARRQARHGVLFYVPDLERYWEHMPRPANIRPFFPLEIQDKRPDQIMLLTGTDPEQISIWAQWAEDYDIPCYLPPENI